MMRKDNICLLFISMSKKEMSHFEAFEFLSFSFVSNNS